MAALPSWYRRSGRASGLAWSNSLAASPLAQEKVFQDELPFPAGERNITDPTRYLLVYRLRPSFGFDYFVKCMAIRAAKEHGVPRHAPVTQPRQAATIPKSLVLGNPAWPGGFPVWVAASPSALDAPVPPSAGAFVYTPSVVADFKFR